MRIIRYLKQAKLAVVLIALLLIVQAFADLSLPRYTSDLVDVGIQQGGVEDASPTALRETTYGYLRMLASDDQEDLIASSYEHTDGGTYAITDYGREHRGELNDAVAMPLVVAYYAEQGSTGEGQSQDAAALMTGGSQEGTFSLPALYEAYEQG